MIQPLEIINRGDGKCILKMNGRYYAISKTMSYIMDSVNNDDHRDINKLRKILDGNNLSYTNQEIEILINEAIKKLEEISSLSKKSNFLNIQIQLLNKGSIDALTLVLSKLCNIRMFYFAIILSGISFVTLITNQQFVSHINFQTLFQVIDNINAKDLSILYSFAIMSSFIHELGHASMLKHFNKQCKQIGIGFYIIFVVFYSDVSEAWELNRFQRIRVSLGGVYFQLYLFMGCVIYYFLSHTTSVLPILLIVAVASSIGMNLLPLLRYDGYWVLSDFIDIPNLRKEEEKLFVSIFRKHTNKQSRKSDLSKISLMNNKKKIIWIIYVCISWVSILVCTILSFRFTLEHMFKMPIFVAANSVALMADLMFGNYYQSFNRLIQIFLNIFILVGMIIFIFRCLMWAKKLTRVVV